MTIKEYMDLLTERAIDYKVECVNSVNKNKHMNKLDGNLNISQDEVEAILTDFINYVGVRFGVDWGLNTKDLIREPKELQLQFDITQ